MQAAQHPARQHTDPRPGHRPGGVIVDQLPDPVHAGPRGRGAQHRTGRLLPEPQQLHVMRVVVRLGAPVQHPVPRGPAQHPDHARGHRAHQLAVLRPGEVEDGLQLARVEGAEVALDRAAHCHLHGVTGMIQAPTEPAQLVANRRHPTKAPCGVFRAERPSGAQLELVEHDRSVHAVAPFEPDSKLAIGRQSRKKVGRHILEADVLNHQRGEALDQIRLQPQQFHRFGLEGHPDVLQHPALLVGELPPRLHRRAEVAVALMALEETLGFGCHADVVGAEIRESVFVSRNPGRPILLGRLQPAYPLRERRHFRTTCLRFSGEVRRTAVHDIRGAGFHFARLPLDTMADTSSRCCQSRCYQPPLPATAAPPPTTPPTTPPTAAPAATPTPTPTATAAVVVTPPPAT